MRRLIKPHVASLRYSASTGTVLGTDTMLNTTLPWAVSFDIDLTRATAQGSIFTLKTDQATPFICYVFPPGSNQRYFDFGSNLNFSRFFPNVSVDPNVYAKSHTGWHQVLITFDGVDRTAVSSYKFYLDAQSITLSSGSGLAATTVSNNIGDTAGGVTRGTFDMADFTIWNGGTVMTAAQVELWYNYYILPSGPTVTHRYQHTDESGTVLTDSVGSQHGTIGSAAWNTNVPTKSRTAV